MRTQFFLLALCILLAACSTRPGQSGQPAINDQQVHQQIQTAQAEIQANHNELARQRLQYLLEVNPDNAEAIKLLGQIPTTTPIPTLSKPNQRATQYRETQRAYATEYEQTYAAESTRRMDKATERAIEIASHTATPRPTSTQTPLATFTPPVPLATPVYLGTQLPDAAPANKTNFEHIGYVGQWGKGNILAMAASPDGRSFVVGSAYGMAIYRIGDLESQPVWVSFTPPFVYENMSFSADGNQLLLEFQNYRQVRNFPDGALLETTGRDIEWLKFIDRMDRQMSDLVSVDGKYRLKSSSTHDEENWNIEFSVRDVYNEITGELLYQLSDPTTYVQYDDTHTPEGCDLYSFSMCGNVYDPSAMYPYRAGFSPTGASLAILYRAPNLWNSNHFSTLRLYDLKSGKLLNQIGSFSRPVETFTYLMDGRVLVGYVNGSSEIWNPGQDRSTFGAWHFNAMVERFSYSNDGKYIYIQRQGELEVRRTSDGALFKRYDSSNYALSPVDNLVAIADEEGNIRLQTVDGQGDRLIKAHTAKVYALEFSPDGKILVSAGQDCAIRAWDVKTGNFLHPFENTVVNAYGEEFTASRIYIEYFKFIPGTTQLLGFGSWGTVVSWNINSGATNYTIASAPLDYYNGMITLNPHFPEFFGTDLAANTFYINEIGYKISTGEKLGPAEQPANLTPGCYAAGPTSADGSVRFTEGYDQYEGQICILDAKDHHIIGQIEVVPQTAILDNVPGYHLIRWLYISPDGRQLVVNTISGALLVYQVVP